MAGSLMGRKRIARGPLSSDILNHVLKYLPLRDAVRTSILSKEWRYKWLTIPYLVFDDNFEKSLPGKYKPESVINRVLACHKGPIVKFTLMPLNFEDDIFVEQWVKLLSIHPIEDLTLDVPPPADLDWVSEPLFTFYSLKHLCLSHTTIKLSPAFEGFTHLLTLYLCGVYIDPKDLHMFVSKCPVLEILHVLEYCEAIDLVIDAPNLKSFHFDGNFKSFVFKNVDIEDISICNKKGYYIDNGDDDGCSGGDDGGIDEDFTLPDGSKRISFFGQLSSDGSNFINFFGHLSSVRKMAFDQCILKFLAKGGVPYKLPIYLNHITTLEFFGVNFRIMDDVACLLCLIRSSPNLQSLDIRCLDYTYTSTAARVIEHLKAQPRCEVPLGHSIKNIRMDNFRGLKTEMEFVKVILLKSMLLRKLIIKFPSNHPPNNVCEVVKALLGFRRASSKGVIKFG